MSVSLTRRNLLRLAGVSTLTAAMAGAVRAEGGVFHLINRSATGSEELAPGQLPFANRTPVRCGEAALRVRDLNTMVRFYQSAIGLTVLEQTRNGATLGVDKTPLLHLISRPDAPFERRNQAGLFHIAFLMPTRTDLARWLVHAAHAQVPLSGFADHSVSEAIYLDDPEGNGLEIYSDRPANTWRWNDGVVTMGTHQLDVNAIVALTTTERSTYDAAPDRLRIGHMHLRVGDIRAGREFYELVLGLASTRGNDPQSAFLSSGGYHHHLAMNIWNSAGAGRRDDGTTGLDGFSLQIEDAALLAAQRERLQRQGHPVAELADSVKTTDPWGTILQLKKV